jgi:hypothetical protein
MFIGPCIVTYFYSKTNQMHQFLEFIYFGITLHMFRTVFPSVTRSSRLYIRHQVYVKQILLSGTPGDGRKDRPKHVECYSIINKFEKLVHLVGFTIGISWQTELLSAYQGLYIMNLAWGLTSLLLSGHWRLFLSFFLSFSFFLGGGGVWWCWGLSRLTM